VTTSAESAESAGSAAGPDPADGGSRTAGKRGLGGDFWKLWTAATVSKVGDGVVMVAIPWLTTELTSSAFLVALMGIAVRLPWLLFSLPAGVWADRLDRRLMMLAVNSLRAVVVGALALLVWTDRLTLPLLLFAALALGFCEVVFDNTSQVILPSVVTDKQQLAAANGRLMGAQMVLGEFVGRPLTGVLLGASLALPFLFDTTAAVVSVLVLCTVRGSFRGGGKAAAATGGAPAVPRRSMRAEIAEGMSWLWSHPMLRSLAIALAWSNAAHAGAFAIYVLYVKEILGLDALGFALLTSVGALGGFLGSLFAARLSRRIGHTNSLLITVVCGFVSTATIALSSNVWVVAVVGTAAGSGVVLWNVVTVTLRQTIVPDGLLGRVNSCYRLLGWGCMPIGMAIGGGVVTLAEHLWSREAGLRTPFLLAALLQAGLFWYVRTRLNQRIISRALDTAAEPGPPNG
jgi:MFS family permease